MVLERYPPLSSFNLKWNIHDIIGDWPNTTDARPIIGTIKGNTVDTTVIYSKIFNCTKVTVPSTETITKLTIKH